MPYRPLKTCCEPGCPNLTSERFCEKHKNIDKKRYDKTRGTPTERGYDSRWRAYRINYLRANPLCVECERENVLKPAVEIDHIIAVNGQQDPLFWEESNHQPLCHRHHSIKTAKENGAFGNKKLIK